MTEPRADLQEEYSGWLPVSQAAAARGISERTLRKRIKAGEVEAIKEAQPGGGVAWRVAPISSERKRTGSRAGSEPEAERQTEPEANRKYSERESASNRKRAGSEAETEPETSDPRTGSGTATGPEAGTESKSDPAHVAHLEAEVLFLRGMIEQHQRSEAELRAALREALRAMPKQLPQSTLQETPQDAPGRPQTGEPGNHKATGASARNRRNSGEMRPLWKVIFGIR